MRTSVQATPQAETPDEFVPDPTVCRELGITSMTLWRYDRDASLDFPAPIKIRGRNFRSRRLLDAWKVKMLRRAVEQRAARSAAGD